MSRVASHVIDSDKIRMIEGTQGSSTSGQITIQAEFISDSAPTGRFYLKQCDNNQTAQIEALALLDTTEAKLPDIYLVKKKNGELSLLTRDNHFIPTHDLFNDPRYTEKFAAIKAKPRSTFAPSLAYIFAGILDTGDDDGHSRNIGFANTLDKLKRVDLDRIRFLIERNYKGSRGLFNVLDHSHADCFTITADLIDRYIYKGRVPDKPLRLPHYHPLAISPLLSSTTNYYSAKEVQFFREIFEDDSFNRFFIEHLIRKACRSSHSLDEAAQSLNIEAELYTDFCNWREERHHSIKEACIHSQGIQEYLLEHGVLNNIKSLVENDCGSLPVLKEIFSPAIATLKHQLINYHYINLKTAHPQFDWKFLNTNTIKAEASSNIIELCQNKPPAQWRLLKPLTDELSEVENSYTFNEEHLLGDFEFITSETCSPTSSKPHSRTLSRCSSQTHLGLLDMSVYYVVPPSSAIAETDADAEEQPTDFELLDETEVAEAKAATPASLATTVTTYLCRRLFHSSPEVTEVTEIPSTITMTPHP